MNPGMAIPVVKRKQYYRYRWSHNVEMTEQDS